MPGAMHLATAGRGHEGGELAAGAAVPAGMLFLVLLLRACATVRRMSLSACGIVTSTLQLSSSGCSVRSVTLLPFVS